MGRRLRTLLLPRDPEGKADCVETRTLLDDAQPNSGGRRGGVLTFPRLFGTLTQGIVLALPISGGESGGVGGRRAGVLGRAIRASRVRRRDHQRDPVTNRSDNKKGAFVSTRAV